MPDNKSMYLKEWVARLLLAPVFFWNIICAIQFIVSPQSYTAAYGLDGTGAVAAIRGFGILFLMWNATYPLFICHPSRYRALGWIILAQQAIGLIGELALLASIDANANVLFGSVGRFALFDGAGLALIFAALIVNRSSWRVPADI